MAETYDTETDLWEPVVSLMNDARVGLGIILYIIQCILECITMCIYTCMYIIQYTPSITCVFRVCIIALIMNFIPYMYMCYVYFYEYYMYIYNAMNVLVVHFPIRYCQVHVCMQLLNWSILLLVVQSFHVPCCSACTST